MTEDCQGEGIRANGAAPLPVLGAARAPHSLKSLS